MNEVLVPLWLVQICRPTHAQRWDSAARKPWAARRCSSISTWKTWTRLPSGRAAAGANVLRPVGDQFYGDRTVQLKDPFGHLWSFATHIEDVSEEEVQRRAKAFMAEHAK